MTRFILRGSAIVLAICLVLSGAMLALASSLLPAQAHVELPGFATCQLPCWAGLTPEITDFDEAARTIRASLPSTRTRVTVTGSVLSFGTVYENRVVSGMAYYNRGKVGTIRLNMAMPLTELLGRLGSPDCVWFIAPSGLPAQLILHWQQDGLVVKTLLVADAWGHLDVNGLALSLEISPDNSSCRGALRWMGFAPAWRYAAG